MNLEKNRTKNPAPPIAEEQPIKVDGFAQVIQMLEVADHAFRESLLKRLSARDPELGRKLRAYLAERA